MNLNEREKKWLRYAGWYGLYRKGASIEQMANQPPVKVGARHLRRAFAQIEDWIGDYNLVKANEVSTRSAKEVAVAAVREHFRRLREAKGGS